MKSVIQLGQAQGRAQAMAESLAKAKAKPLIESTTTDNTIKGGRKKNLKLKK